MSIVQIQPSRPIIDRSLKAKALMKSVRNPSQNEVLEAERDIVEESLRLENEELKMEEEWEKLRLRKENALSEEMRSQVNKKTKQKQKLCSSSCIIYYVPDIVFLWFIAKNRMYKSIKLLLTLTSCFMSAYF